MAETLNMLEITVDKFIEEVKLDLEDENYDPVIGIGKSGVGKTMSIYELTQELKIGFCELRLVTLTEVDLLGIPITQNGRTTYASNDLLPNVERDGEAGILVLDEITSASATIRAAAYQLLDSKRALGNYHLPEHWKVVALGNGPDDGGVFTGIEVAFLSRALCYRIEPNLDAFKKWAIPNHVNSSILAYLSFEPSNLHKFNPDEMAGVFPCPRSWTALSKRLNAREEKNGGMLPLEDVQVYAAGAIGAEVAPAFAAFYSYNSKTISPEDILSGKIKGSEIRDVDTEVVYLVIQSLIKQIGAELEKGQISWEEFTPEAVQRTANLCNWIIDVADYKLDYAIMCLTDLSEGVPLFRQLVLLNDDFDDICPRLVDFANKNGIIFKAN